MSPEKNKIVMAGCHEAGFETIKFLLEHDIKISHFVSITLDMAKKASIAGYKDFAPLARQYKIPIYHVKKYSLDDADDTRFFEEQKFDLLIQGGWQRLFPEAILKTLRVGAVGGHGSSERLPKGRGRSPINWSLIEDKKRFIMHHFIIKPGIDDGDVFASEEFEINPWDTCRTLYYKNSIVTKRALLKWIPKLLAGDYQAQPQVGEPSYYPKRTPEDGLIDWNKSAYEIYNLVRAVTHPYPGAFSYLNKKQIMIWDAQPFDSQITYPDAKVGDVVEVFETGDAVVKCGEGLLLVTKCEPSEMTLNSRFS